MKRKRTYGSVDVESLELDALLKFLAVGCIVAVDVAKSKFVAAIATAAGEVVRLVRFEHPRQTGLFLRILVALRDAKLEPRVTMEPTGTYGDALRYQCDRLQLPVHMASPKHTHDLAEVLDGVPSMHDPKAAVALARLAVIRPTKRWEPDSDAKRELRALLDRRAPLSRTQTLYYGLLEGMLARHWPELDALLDVHAQRSWMSLLQRLPGPQAVAASPEEATEVLRQASRGSLPQASILAVVESARTTLGVPMTKEERVTLGVIAQSIERETRQMDAIDKQLGDLCRLDPEMARMASVIGPACTTAIVGYIGRPSSFANAGALEKAMGLNLRERSSGEKKGRLSITKRGPGQVRKLLYLAALRTLMSDPVVAAWYQGRAAYRRDMKGAAVVAVMRKLARALWHVARGSDFDSTKLFDTRRLEVKPPHKRAGFLARDRSSSATPTIHPGGAPQPTP
jgi:transposase